MYIGYEQVPVSTTVKTAADFVNCPSGAVGVELQCAASAGGINYTMDNATNPGDQRGMYLAAGHPPKFFHMDDFKRLRFVSVDGANSHLHAHYIGRA